MASRSAEGTPEPMAQQLECDIVMAGGITSGVIYPGAVAMIARRYAFRSIGGTSVGAIAAAVTAAAEYGRLSGRNSAAFNYVGSLAKTLSDRASDGHTRLFHLFKPEQRTQRVFSLLTPIFGKGAIIASLLGVALDLRIGLPAALALVLIVYFGWALSLGHGPIEIVFLAIALLMLFLVVCVIATGSTLFLSWLPAMRDNGYGLCTGSQSSGAKPPKNTAPLEGLTVWMNRVVQEAAGRNPDDQPLTFGDLWTASAPDKRDLVTTEQPRDIDLAMIASDLSRSRAVQLPFLETPSPLYVNRAVLERYFPNSVVDWMAAHAGEDDKRVEKGVGVFRWPRPQDLPIVVAARMSLSFPVLLSAVPLLTPDFAASHAKGKLLLRSVWYSDGGLVSNFPVHFFDAPIPSRPTFCLNLVAFGQELTERIAPDEIQDEPDGVEAAALATDATASDVETTRAKPIARPYAPERKATGRPAVVTDDDPKPGDPIWGFIATSRGNQLSPVPFGPFDQGGGSGFLSFAKSLLAAARQWSDNQMLIAPGVRERVVSIGLFEDEGGLNLDMTADTIASLDLRGRAAGLLASARFDPEQAADPETGEGNINSFPRHRWTRFRNFMGALEDMSRRFVLSRQRSDAAAAARGEPTLDDMFANPQPAGLGYPIPVASRPFYREATTSFEEFALDLVDRARNDENATFDRARGKLGSAPRPKMRLRLRPLWNNDPREERADLPARQSWPTTPRLR